MFQLAPTETIFTIFMRSAVIYAAVLVGLRLSGKREIGQMTALDLVVLLLLANAVQNAMVGADTSLLGGLIAGGTLLGLHWLLSLLQGRSQRLRRALEGSPTLLVLHGNMIPEAMQHEGVDTEMLYAALREHGFSDIREVEMVVLETDGTMSVVPIHVDTKRTRRVHGLRNKR